MDLSIQLSLLSQTKVLAKLDLIHCVSKNVPPLTFYNLDIHDPFAIIFGEVLLIK